jgi:hypothetical protein
VQMTASVRLRRTAARSRPPLVLEDLMAAAARFDFGDQDCDLGVERRGRFGLPSTLSILEVPPLVPNWRCRVYLDNALRRFAGSSMGGTGLEPVTPSLSIRGNRSRPSPPVR